MNRRRRPGRVARLLPSLLLVAACTQPAATGVGPGESPASSGAVATNPTPTLPPPTAWSTAVGAIGDDGRYSLDAALKLFATAYGPLPGVDVARDLSGVTDTTIAIRAVMAHRDELTPEQRAAVDKALAFPTGPDVVSVPPVAAAMSHVVLAATITKEQQDWLLGTAKHFRERIVGKLGHDFIGDIKLAFLGTPDSSGAAADAWSDWPGGVFGNCQIRLLAGFYAELPQVRDQMLAHEVFHCFQLDAYRTIEAQAAIPDWVMEGQASWVAADLIPLPDNWWIEWLQHPMKPLTKRAYDAIGFYAHLAESGTDPWSIFQAMWQAGSGNTELYVASQATADAFQDSAASGVVVLPNLGAGWTTGGAGMVGPEWGYRSPDIALDNGAKVSFTAPIFTNDVKTLNVSADMIHITENGHARLGDGTIDTTTIEDAWFCIEDHKCQSDCPGDGPAQVFRGTLDPRFLFALAGGLTTTTATIEGVKYEPHDPCDTPEPTNDDFCTKYRDYVAWTQTLGPEPDITQALAAEVARRFDEMYPVAPAQLKDWVALVWKIYATFAGNPEPRNVPLTGQVPGIAKLPDALHAMHAYCGIPWPAS